MRFGSTTTRAITKSIVHCKRACSNYAAKSLRLIAIAMVILLTGACASVQTDLDDHLAPEAQKYWQLAVDHLSDDPPNEPLGLQNLFLAADRGSRNAINEIGRGYLFGEYGLAPNLPAARNWLMRAYDMGDSRAAVNLAESYRLELDLTVDEQSVTKWLRSGAEGNHPEIMFELGFRMLEGVGTEVNFDTGRTLIAEAVKAGFSAREYVVENISRDVGAHFILFIKDEMSKTASAPEEIFNTIKGYAKKLEKGYGVNREWLINDDLHSNQTIRPQVVTAILWSTYRTLGWLGDKEAQKRLAFPPATFGKHSRVAKEAPYWQRRLVQ